MSKINIAVSACLLGQKVRYDGTDKYIQLDKYFNPKKYKLIPICPELEMGLTVPREPIELNRINNELRLLQVNDKDIDLTQMMENWFSKKQFNKISGYLLKSQSPSCGFQSTKVFTSDSKVISHNQNGMFVELLLKQKSNTAIINEKDVFDPLMIRTFKNNLLV